MAGNRGGQEALSMKVTVEFYVWAVGVLTFHTIGAPSAPADAADTDSLADFQPVYTIAERDDRPGRFVTAVALLG
jgi:hypothetical protein